MPRSALPREAGDATSRPLQGSSELQPSTGIRLPYVLRRNPPAARRAPQPEETGPIVAQKRRPRRSPNGRARPYFDKSKHRWYQVVAVDGTRKKVSGATKEEVSAVAEQVRADLVAGRRVLGDSRRTVAQLLDYWSTEIAPQRVRESTLDTYQRMIRLYLRPLLGDIRLTALDFDDIERMQQTMARDGKAHATVLQARKVLSAALKWAVKKRWVAANPVSYADMPVGTRAATVTRHLDANEFALLREQLPGDRLECAYLLCCYLGLRRGEVLGRVWSDIDFGQRRVVISRQLRRTTVRTPGRGPKTQLVLTPPKTASSARELRLPDCAVDALLRHRALQQAERDGAESRSAQPEEGELVFTSLTRGGKHGGGYADIDNFGHRLVEHADAAGIGHLSPHGLRHTGVSFLYNDGGVDMK